jgi:hypothetical protein
VTGLSASLWTKEISSPFMLMKSPVPQNELRVWTGEKPILAMGRLKTNRSQL